MLLGRGDRGVPDLCGNGQRSAHRRRHLLRRRERGPRCCIRRLEPPGHDLRHRTGDDPAAGLATAKVRSVFVHPDWARHGLGRKLMQRVEAEAWSAGFNELEMNVLLSGRAVLLRARLSARAADRAQPAGQRHVPRHGDAEVAGKRGRRTDGVRRHRPAPGHRLLRSGGLTADFGRRPRGASPAVTCREVSGGCRRLRRRRRRSSR